MESESDSEPHGSNSDAVVDDHNSDQQSETEETDQQAEKVAENLQQCASLLLTAYATIKGQKRKQTAKKRIAVKASKGRAVRYVTIPKLVNFYPAVLETSSRYSELYKSLFC